MADFKMIESAFQSLNKGGMRLRGVFLRTLEQVLDIPVKVTQQFTAFFVNRLGVFDFIVKLKEMFA